MKKRKDSGSMFFKPTRTSKTKTPQGEIVVAIDRMSAEGRGMAFHSGKPLFVPNTLPGDSARVRITLDKREYAEGELLEVINAAEQRIAPLCELFGRCGGCSLQMLDYAAQLQHKSATLTRILKTHIETLSEPIVAAPWHYRHRARLAVGENNGKPLLGLKAANSHRVIAVSACVILDERLQLLLTELPRVLETLENWQRIEEISIAIDSMGKVAMIWRAKRALSASDENKLIELCEAENVISEKEAKLIYSVPSQNTVFSFSVSDFTQVNPAINDQLVARAVQWLQPDKNDSIADFFCGLGNFSLPLARYAKRVTGYEIDAAMVGRAAANAGNCGNLEFCAADLYASDAANTDSCIDDSCIINSGITDTYDAALLDPPRAGAKALCGYLAKAKKLRRIVYVSCNPQTLVRDLDILARGGFRVERAALVDMFPQTGHIETIVLLKRR